MYKVIVRGCDWLFDFSDSALRCFSFVCRVRFGANRVARHSYADLQPVSRLFRCADACLIIGCVWGKMTVEGCSSSNVCTLFFYFASTITCGTHQSISAPTIATDSFGIASPYAPLFRHAFILRHMKCDIPYSFVHQISVHPTHCTFSGVLPLISIVSLGIA